MTLPFQWRVTRYDPALRNAQGHYPLGDWSCFSEVGKVFNGQQLTYQQYWAYETAYANAAAAFMTEANLDVLRVDYLEQNSVEQCDAVQREGITFVPSSLKSGSMVSQEMVLDIVRLNLREIIWCKLAAGGAAGSQFYLHFGWDFYMYIGSLSSSVKAIHDAENNGLFVEPMASPYL